MRPEAFLVGLVLLYGCGASNERLRPDAGDADAVDADAPSPEPDAEHDSDADATSDPDSDVDESTPVPEWRTYAFCPTGRDLHEENSENVRYDVDREGIVVGNLLPHPGYGLVHIR